MTTQATDDCGNVVKVSIATRQCDVPINVPPTRVLHTPVLSEVSKVVMVILLLLNSWRGTKTGSLTFSA